MVDIGRRSQNPASASSKQVPVFLAWYKLGTRVRSYNTLLLPASCHVHAHLYIARPVSRTPTFAKSVLCFGGFNLRGTVGQTQREAVGEVKDDLEKRAQRLTRRLEEERASKDEERIAHESAMLAVRAQVRYIPRPSQ